MSKHTPGPWKAVPLRSGFRIDANLDVVVDTSDLEGRYGTIAEGANARLIAAAPELLEALKSFISLYGTDDATAWQFIRDKAVTAIAKATGEQP